MEKMLKRKFIMFSIGAVALVLGLLVAIVNIANYVRVDNQVDTALEALSSGNSIGAGSWLDEYLSDNALVMQYMEKYFVVYTNEQGDITSIYADSIDLITVEEAITIGTEAIDSGSDSGRLYGFSYLAVQTEVGYKYTFVDSSQNYALCSAFLNISGIVFVTVLGAVSIVLVCFAGTVVAPIAKSHEKQKQFVTNITHEFKTPLAIIKANTEVSEMVSEKTQWTESTHHQIERLNKLINNLLYLAKLEEGTEVIKTHCNLSALVTENAEPFVALAESQDRTLNLDIDDDISYTCDENAISTLVSILLENAIKYSCDNTAIDFCLNKVKDRVELVCTNSASGLTVGNYDHWLDRFYRKDASRSSKGNSFGIGLSTAKAIAVNHDAKISVNSPDAKMIIIKVDFAKV